MHWDTFWLFAWLPFGLLGGAIAVLIGLHRDQARSKRSVESNKPDALERRR